ncbi:TPA_asm: hypothetical protein GYV56_12610 [Listeria monocytogenes]|uniref:phage tail spike protein n=1 Tax=Listeria monocytogenes TaxID=1639 RepID=UPI000BE0AAA7|nr:phage tail spike protein [Listeria monocytogenes]EAE4828484.1 hypothetical protein [Listeria monocytogenes]EHP7829788.1 phage tail protein [Listeria monocytogenes]PDA36720.1 hypothetical protein A4Q59_00600 [Listeria monocytogenes]PDA49128.1 hypothetical protein A4Q53_05080 [Listeria monocytogenes]PDA71096.1 hypothetical protein A4Q45_03260 [Listeria monocytogenes]
MYFVKFYEDHNDKKGLLIHSPYSDRETKLKSAKMKTKLKGIDEFSFGLHFKNPGFGKIKPLVSLIEVIESGTGRICFSGRVLKPKHGMAADGSFTQDYVCESKMAYLYDSNQRYLEMKDTTISAYFKKIIEGHNSRVEPHKRFKVGRITAQNTTATKHRWIGYEKTYDTIRDQLLDIEGGYLQLREEDTGTYLDYSDISGEYSTTKLEIAKNLKSVSREIDTSNVATRIVPLGEALNDSDGAASPRLTISNINGGLDYLDNNELQKEFGIIESAVIWDDAAGSSDLLEKCKTYMKTQNVVSESWSVSALDLSLAGYDLDTFEVGNSYTLVNPFISPEEPLTVIEKELDLINPASSELTIGEKQKSLSEYQVDTKKMKTELSKMKGSVMSQQAKVTQLGDDLSSVNESITALQKDLADANLTDIANRLQIIQDSLFNIELNYATLSELESVQNTQAVEIAKQSLINAQLEARILALEEGVTG